MHTVPTPRLGGVAIFVSTLIAVLLLRGVYNLAQLGGILVGAALISLLGFWDDRFSLSAGWKVVGTVVAAGLLLVDRCESFVIPFPLYGLTRDGCVGYWYHECL